MNMNINNDNDFKIIIVGDCKTGKTTLIKRIVYDKFISDINENNFHTKNMKNGDKNIKLTFFDINEKIQNITPQFYNNSNAAIVTFDLTSIESFRSVTFWIEKTIQNTSLPFIILIGTKADLFEKKCIDNERIEKYCENHKNNIIYIETSAKTGKNINFACEIINKNIFIYKTDKVKNVSKLNYNTFDNPYDNNFDTINLIPHKKKSKIQKMMKKYIPCLFPFLYNN
jgi:small GTP-binding protein